MGLRGCEGAPEVPTSGITQPPVLATAVRALHEADPDPGFLEEVVPALERWHRWLHDERAGESGLVAILHPWEAADNSPRFDAALARLEITAVPGVERTDRRVVAADERPTDTDYVRYRYLVERLREQDYRPGSLADAPLVYVDLTFNSILAAAEDDLAVLWSELGEDARRASDAARRLREALSGRWDEARAIYTEDDAEGTADETIDGLFPLYAGVPSAAQARRLFDEALWSPVRFGPSREAPWAVTSASKASTAFDPRRYWRGPIWVNINWFLVQGLARAGLRAEAHRARSADARARLEVGVCRVLRPEDGRAARRQGLLVERVAHARSALARPRVTYDPNPRHPVVGGEVESGFAHLADEISRERPHVLAVDGPAALPWDEFLRPLLRALKGRGRTVELIDARRLLVPWEEIRRRTASAVLDGDPVFGRLFEGSLSDLLAAAEPSQTDADTTVVFGPGSALGPHDRLWYADIPKWQSLARIQKGLAENVGQPPGEAGSEQRLLFVDWPLLERHKQALLPSLDRYLDLGDPERPRSLRGAALRESLHRLAGGPFRARPTFLPGPGAVSGCGAGSASRRTRPTSPGRTS